MKGKVITFIIQKRKVERKSTFYVQIRFSIKEKKLLETKISYKHKLYSIQYKF